MTLRDLLESRIKLTRYRPIDLAKVLNKSRQSVSLTLHRDLNSVTVRTLREYLEATGVRVDFTKLIRDQ